jgi:unsaturated rhamnogalacturonyl hydrolase
MTNVYFLLSITAFILFFSTCTGTDDIDRSRMEHRTPREVGKMVTDDLLSRPEFMMYKTDFLTAVHYAEACAGFGAARLSGLLGDTLTVKMLADRYESVLQDTVLTTVHHVDAQVYGILPLELYHWNKDVRLFRQGMELADIQWENADPDGITRQARYWIDDVWMIGSLQVQAYRATGRMVYLDRAAVTVDAYLKKLQQPNGLFHHGIDAPFFWGRGNGWVAAGLAELLSELPESHPLYHPILRGYVKMMDALVRYQAQEGMWRQLIDVKESWKETSSTAMFGYALSVGVKKGILTDPAYTGAYQNAWKTLTEYIDDQGRVTEVCAGTGKSSDIEYYLNRPRMTGDLHGQASILWFAGSIIDE